MKTEIRREGALRNTKEVVGSRSDVDSQAETIRDLKDLKRRIQQAAEIMVDERGNLIRPEAQAMESVAQMPPIAFQDYPVDIHLGIYQEKSRYRADILAEGQRQRFHIEMSPYDISVLNKRFQEAVGAVSHDNTDCDESGLTPAELEGRIRTLAEVGHYAFKRVFGSPDAQAIVREVLSLGSAISLQIASESFFLPWELIYPNSLNEPPSYECFWGMKHIISRIIDRQHHPGAFVAPVIHVRDRPNVGLLTDCSLQGVVEKEIPFFESLDRNGKIALFKLRAMDSQKRQEELEEFRCFLRRNLDLAHFACHASYEDAAPDLSHILLSDEFPITLMDMEVYGITIDNHPLIVLNACETGNLNPLYTSHFSAAFLRYGARGVVATGCPVPDAFAADFVEQLYTHLLGGKLLGESLLAARRHFLEKHGNPSGLLYSLDAPPSIRLVVQVGE